MAKQGKSVLDGGLSPKTMKEMKANGAKLLRKPQPKGKGKPTRTVLEHKGEVLELKPVGASFGGNGKPPPRPKQRPKEFTITTEIYQGSNRLTVEQAKALIGWTVVGASQKGQKGTGDSYTGRFHLRDLDGNKIVLSNNSTNRPFRIGLAKRYMSDMLRRKWFLNGESTIFDWTGKCQSGQHRLVGFILAEQARVMGLKAGTKYEWTKRYWKGPVVIDALIVRGISDEREVADSIDQGQKRSLGDVVYRAELFSDMLKEGDKVGTLQIAATDTTFRKLSNILAGATRLVWLRAGGKRISDAPHFPVSEAMEFISNHERLKEFVLLMFNLDGGTAAGGNRITRFLTMGYASALCYLMSISGTDPEAWTEARKDSTDGGVSKLDFSMEKQARLFWERMANGTDLAAGDPIHVVREALHGMPAGSADQRDEIVGMIITAFNLWSEGVDKAGKYTGKKVTAKDVQMRRMEREGKMVLASDPRLGGIDIEGREEADTDAIEELFDDVPVGDAKAKSGKKGKAQPTPKGKAKSAGMESKYRPDQDEREGSKAGKQWAEGDTAWVRPQKGSDAEPYFATVQAFHKGEGVPDSVDLTDDQNREWNEPVSQLCLKYPG